MPNLTKFTQLLFRSLDSNNMSGLLPLISSNLVYLGLSDNSFLGSISHFLCDKINETKRLEALKLNDNYLQGELPDCWMSDQNLKILKLSNNKFIGNLPNSFGSLAFLVWLDLGKNRLFGTIPATLKNCTALESLDVERFSRMVVLNLRSNKFHGPLPTRFCDLAILQILDIADNNLSGAIPNYINNVTGMVTTNSFSRSAQQHLHVPLDVDVILMEKASVVSREEVVEYNEILNLVMVTIVSRNDLLKNVPLEVRNLKATQSLNFSHNTFT
ncbi:hypothetical protein CUMW_140090 [Citrus unshiu]|uniref:Leucine-rich repeat-containing N-terminal plant-type domain-containing protein n=1 Tax=Citrus sinensis TaxID=2711 RepID=A0A067ED09_CITSI|nr:hypothetical protein CISIN_1g043038mg [Citrus sinensis]GAY52200.1 hypothetical protein CUMW_140090 [Citrus unshiu]